MTIEFYNTGFNLKKNQTTEVPKQNKKVDSSPFEELLKSPLKSDETVKFV